MVCVFFFFKKKTAYEMRISDWSSDVCSSDLETAVESMPRTIAAYITPTREAATGIMATFEALWRDIKKLMGQKSRAWTIANFSKKELRRAVESASYAAGTYPRIEKKGGDSSLLVF